MGAIQKVTTNSELLHYIFKMLNLQDQIQTISVCKEFEYVIEHFIWKLKFKEIKIKEPDDDFYMGFADAADNEYNLTESEYQTFIPIISKHVQKLIINKRCKDKLTDVYKFENLKLLEFIYTIVTQKNLKSLATNCPKLETINFIYCENVNNSIFDLNKRGQIETLAKVRWLKHLKLSANIYFDWSQLKEILNQFCLKSLALQVYFYRDEVEEVYFKNANAIEYLNIDCIYETEAWLQFEDLYLSNFKNLTTLSLIGREAIFRDSNMATLATACNKLQELTLIEWKILIKQFPKQLTLKKLIIKNCVDLPWKILQQILGELNLVEFVSEETEYEGDCDFFYDTCAIANTLQIIDIKTKQNQEFLEFFKYVNNTPEKLKIFRYEFTENSPHSVLKNFIKLCTNLQELHITNVAIPFNDLMKLKSLRILKFYIFPTITWLFLETILTHRTLANICIEMTKRMESKINNDNKKPNNDDDDEGNAENNEDDMADFDLMILKENCNKISTNFYNLKTNLQFIKIPFILFHKHQDMFLDLLNLKKNLKLTLYCYFNPEEMLNQTFLNRLLNNTKFPSHIKYIKILNKYYDCKDLKENFRTTVDDVSDNNGCLIVTL